jgi:hypothetical protein
MSIPPGSLQLELDAGNPSSYSGSGTSWNDLSGNGNGYTMVNPVYSSTYGGYFSFVGQPDGTAPYNYGFKTNLGPFTTAQNDYTMQMWVRVKGQPAGQIDGGSIFGNGAESSAYGYYFGVKWAFYAFSGRIPTLGYPGFASYAATDAADAVPLNTWVLITVTVDSSNNLKIYYNSTLIYSENSIATGPNPPAVNAQLYIGTNNPSLYYNQSFNGDIAILRFYDAALDAADIIDQYNSEYSRFIPPKSVELNAANASSYPGTGNTWFDLTANNNDLTLYGNTTFTDVSGIKSFDFDGTNSYAYSPTVSIGATNQFTIQSWIKINGTKTQQFINCLGQAAANTFPLQAYNVSGVTTDLYGEFGGGVALSVYNSPSLDTWYNLTMSANGSSVSYYVNGSSVNTVSQAAGTIPASSELAIGNHVPSPVFPAWFDGNVGYYSVLNGPIGPEDVLNIYNSQLPGYIALPPVTGLSNGRRFGQGFPQ